MRGSSVLRAHGNSATAKPMITPATIEMLTPTATVCSVPSVAVINSPPVMPSHIAGKTFDGGGVAKLSGSLPYHSHNPSTTASESRRRPKPISRLLCHIAHLVAPGHQLAFCDADRVRRDGREPGDHDDHREELG